MMAIPIIQHIQNEYASTPVESYSYYNEMVRFVGSNAFIGFDGNLFPVSWNVFEANPNYSPGPQVNPFSISTNNTNTSAPLIEETFSNYTTKRIESVWQNSAVMIKWNHYVKIAEIFSFTSSGIDASIVVKNLNVTNTYISTFSLGMGMNSTMAVNGFNPPCQNISSGTGIIPSNDWNVSVGNISVNWQSEDSIFHSGVAAGCPVNAPVYTLVNNGHGNPSYLQYLNMIIKDQPANSLLNQSNEYILNYFTYSASITVVPIAHSYTFCQFCGTRTAPNTYDFTQNDYVNATSNGNGGYIYNGISYTAAISLPLYMPFEG